MDTSLIQKGMIRDMEKKAEGFHPKVSIVIPVYNGSNYLREAIDSALAQTYKNIEVIVVNDGSTDGGRSDAVAKSYGDKIRYFSKENGGVATALNRGIKEMTGEYFSWLSHDDMYLPHKIERQIDYLSDAPTGRVILYGDFEALKVETGDSQTCVTPSVKPESDLRSTLYLLFGGAIHGCTILLPIECFNELGLFNEKLRTVQDYEFWFKLLKAQYKFRHIAVPLIVTRWHKGQGTLSMADTHHQELERLYIWAFEEFYEGFRSFSCEQVASFVMLLKNRMLRESPARIMNRWPENQHQRECLLSIIKEQEMLRNSGVGALKRKLAGHPLLMKLAKAGHETLTGIRRILKAP